MTEASATASSQCSCSQARKTPAHSGTKVASANWVFYPIRRSSSGYSALARLAGSAGKRTTRAQQTLASLSAVVAEGHNSHWRSPLAPLGWRARTGPANTVFAASSACTSKQRRDSSCALGRRAGELASPRRRAVGRLTLGQGSISVTKFAGGLAQRYHQPKSPIFATAAASRAAEASAGETAASSLIGTVQVRTATFA